MSNFKRQWKRIAASKSAKKAKLHLKYAKQLISTLDEVSKYLSIKDNITEDNLEEEFAKITDMKLGTMERNYVLKQIKHYKWEIMNNKK